MMTNGNPLTATLKTKTLPFTHMEGIISIFAFVTGNVRAIQLHKAFTITHDSHVQSGNFFAFSRLY